jgi:hypothetical protein
MILLCGIASETPLLMVQEQLARLGIPYVLFNQRQFSTIEMEFWISGGHVRGRLQLEDRSYRLEDFHGIYTRLMDDQLLPELMNEPVNSPKRRYCRAIHDTLVNWCEIAPARVVNRTAPMGSNFSKPYQAQLIRENEFEVPETLITNDPTLVLEFRKKHKRLIYKSISSVRSIVKTLEDGDLLLLDKIRWCPTQFQEYVEGTNVRVHTIGSEVFATSISADSTDYRYGNAELKTFELSDELSEKCVKLSQALGLDFAGIDLKITPEGRIFCFEVNPSPAFSYYEANTGQLISKALALYLAGGE